MNEYYHKPKNEQGNSGFTHLNITFTEVLTVDQVLCLLLQMNQLIRSSLKILEVSDTLIDENWGTKKFANLLKVTQLVNSRDSNSGSLALIHHENLFQTQRNLGWESCSDLSKSWGGSDPKHSSAALLPH